MNLSNPINVEVIVAVWQMDGLPFHIDGTRDTELPSDVGHSVDVLVVLVRRTPDVV
ncbi:hypothetical protein D3C72_331670 [compost metagenome]